MRKIPELSVVVPVFNEEAVVDTFISDLPGQLGNFQRPFRSLPRQRRFIRIDTLPRQAYGAYICGS
jgi:glycosyltransferase involved in cell wall biosynthesis